MTRKREMENYIHSDIVREVFGVQIEIDDTMDVSTEISNTIRANNPEGYKPDTVKKKLNTTTAATEAARHQARYTVPTEIIIIPRRYSVMIVASEKPRR